MCYRGLNSVGVPYEFSLTAVGDAGANILNSYSASMSFNRPFLMQLFEKHSALPSFR